MLKGNIVKRKIGAFSDVCIFLILFTLFFSIQSNFLRGEDLSQYKIVDNFNDGKDPNMIGGKKFFEVSGGAYLEQTYFNNDLQKVLGGDGFSLRVEYMVPIGEFAKFGILLNEIDVSKADKILFWVKGENGNEAFDFIIDDGHGNKKKASIQYIDTEWKKIELSVSFFEGVNFGHLDYMMLDFGKKDSMNDGIVYIDDISFYSNESEIFTRSLLDNISGFPERKLASLNKINRLINIGDDKAFIREIAKDTWKYFENIVDINNHLVLDYIDIAPEQRIGDFTSVTNVGLDIMSIVSAYDLNFISEESAIKRIQNMIKVIETLPRWNGLWYNFYSTTNLQIGREYISSVDNGWLAAGFIVARNAFPELYQSISILLEGMDFSVFYSEKLGQINVGYDVATKVFSPYHYGLLCTEPRATSLIGIGKGDLPKEHWFRIARTLPEDADWQQQKPKGIYMDAFGLKYFQGYYRCFKTKVVPSWGGSMFEFLMPTLVMKELALAPQALGLNDQNAVDIQMQYAKRKRYPVWGISPCSTPNGSNGGYAEFGVPIAGTQKDGYKDEGVITPHATFMALYVRPQDAIENLRKMLKLFDIYGEYGFYDSVDVRAKNVSYRYLALDQGMSFIAMNNFINNGIIRRRFHEDEYIKNVEYLLSMENFFLGKKESEVF